MIKRVLNKILTLLKEFHKDEGGWVARHTAMGGGSEITPWSGPGSPGYRGGLSGIMSPESMARTTAFSAWQKPRAARPARRAPVQGEPGYTGGHKTYGKGRTTPVKKKKKPRFGEVGTLAKQQTEILRGLMGAQAPTYAPVSGAGMAEAGGWSGPRPEYAAMGLAGAGERQAAMSRMMAVSPEEERTAIERMSAPAMRQFREEILPGIAEGQAGTRTTWSTMHAKERAKAGAGLAESLAGMGEQYRMTRRGQALQAAPIGRAEAMAPAQLGLQRYGMEMPSYMQAQQIGMAPALQAQQLTASASERRRAMLAQMMGIPMMSIYSY